MASHDRIFKGYILWGNIDNQQYTLKIVFLTISARPNIYLDHQCVSMVILGIKVRIAKPAKYR